MLRQREIVWIAPQSVALREILVGDTFIPCRRAVFETVVIA
jgi:hypothetical protein